MSHGDWDIVAGIVAAVTLIFSAGYNWNTFKQSERAQKMIWDTIEADRKKNEEAITGLRKDANGLGAKINAVDARRRKLAVALLTDDKDKLVRSAEE
jgi:hypothetical protein